MDAIKPLDRKKNGSHFVAKRTSRKYCEKKGSLSYCQLFSWCITSKEEKTNS